MNEITPGDVRKWQNEMVAFRYENGKSYSQTYKKTKVIDFTRYIDTNRSSNH